jgi:hypothetical protein
MGARIDAKTRDLFRASYLYTGNATKSAKLLGFGEARGRDIARELRKDPAFVAECRELRGQALDEVERALMGVVRTAERRFHGKMPLPCGDAPVIDKRPDYGKLVVDAHRTILGRTRHDVERDGTVVPPGGINITITGPDGAEQESDV